MMAALAAILPVVARSSSLALELYRVAAGSQEAATELIKAAKVINHFALNLKHIGTIVKEDDRLPSHEAIATLEDVTDQAQKVLDEIESVTSAMDAEQQDRRNNARYRQTGNPHRGSTTVARLAYLSAHLEALSATLSVQLQTLFTAQSIMWSKLRPTISPQQAAAAVTNEKHQLETLIIEQQILILSATKIFSTESTRSGSRLLMETDASQSLVTANRDEVLSTATLQRYQDEHINTLDMIASTEAGWLPVISSITSTQSERLLEKWTSLPQFDDRLRDAEREVQKQKQENQQPTVESDSEDNMGSQSKLASDGARRTRRRSGSVQPLFTDPSQPIPGSEHRYGPAAPMSPAESPRNSRNNLTADSDLYSSTSPRSSIGSLPVEAAAAVEAKEDDDDVDLEIPWTLCARKYYWKYVDAKQVDTNTDQPPSLAFLERHSWTEILASWVCKEAIREEGLRYTPVQKDKKDGRRTKFETLFLIEKPLQFDQVKRLVERTVQIYRRTAPPPPPPPPPPQVRRPSFNRPPPPRLNGIDRDRTPVPRNTHPPLERSSSSMLFAPPPGPPPLDRSLSNPGPGLTAPNPRTPNLQIPMPPGSSYTPHLPPHPQSSPRVPQYPTQPAAYPFQPTYTSSPQYAYPPAAPFSSSLAPHLQPQPNYPPQSPLRHTYLHPHAPLQPSARSDDLTTSESESGERERARRQRSKSRSRYAGERRKKSHRTSKAAGALLGVGGLTALLDGLGGL